MKNYTLITGASSGIGYAFAQYYAKNGHNILLIARSKNKLQEMKKNLSEKYKIDVQWIACDLSYESSIHELYQQVKEMDVNIDVLVNCAGMATSGNVCDVDFEKQHREIMLNVVALFDLTKLFLHDMITLNQGKIINVASSSAYHPIPTMAVYAASKAFVLSFTEALSVECNGTNVQVFAISPGATDTNFFSNGGGVAYGTLRTPEGVVETTMKAMNKNKISKIDGANNYFTSTFLPRMLPRKKMVTLVSNIMRKQID